MTRLPLGILSVLLAFVVAITIASMFSGCAMDTQLAKAQAEAAKSGCICAAVQCEAVLSASGRAAANMDANTATRNLVLDLQMAESNAKATTATRQRR